MKTLCQTQRNKYCMTLLTSRGRVIETESKVEVTRDWGEGETSQERKRHLMAPAPNLGGCRGEGGAGRLLIV